MDKRTFIAIGLSLLVLLSWSALVSKTYHVDNKQVTAQTATLPSAPALTPDIKAQQTPLAQELNPIPALKYGQEKLDINFIENYAAIQEVIFKSHQNDKLILKYGLLLAEQKPEYKKINSSIDSIEFVASDQKQSISKKFIFSKTSYDIWLEIKVRNLSNAAMDVELPLIIGNLDFSSNDINTRYQDVVVATSDKTQHLSAHKDKGFNDIKFIGLRDRYFCFIVQPSTDNFSGYIKKTGAKDSEIGLVSPKIMLQPGAETLQRFHIYLGPQELKTIESINSDWTSVINYGSFDFISQILVQALNFFYRLVHNWGWAIVILSLMIYLVLFPLSIKQMRSMKEMQVLQPKIEALRQSHKDNPQRLNKEIMELYREHKVNPLSGCLPLLLQMPIFIALYQALMRLVALKGATFLWIKDLSEPDRLFPLPFPKPFDAFNILPILMMLGMFVQQKVSAGAASGAAAEQQKIMMFVMPLLFGFIFYSMPSGLVLYWFINSALMLAFQLRINKSR